MQARRTRSRYQAEDWAGPAQATPDPQLRGGCSTRAARLALKPKKRKIAPQIENSADMNHDDQVAYGAKAASSSSATPNTANAAPATNSHRRWRAWPAATAASSGATGRPIITAR